MWFAKARMDLKTAKHLNPIEEDFYGSIVFHSQQCAEKAIKGFLTFSNIRVLKTHDMDKLLKAIATIDPDLAVKFASLSILTKYAVEYRYPDAELKLPPLATESVENAVELAEQVLEELSKLIK
jgi:HEPN domain-containing protein